MAGAASGFARTAERMPPWLGSIRFRLTAIYSLMLFGLAAMVVGGLYAGLSRELDKEPVSKTYVVNTTSSGVEIREVQDDLAVLERLVNQRALEQLRNYSLFALSLLFLTSMGVGWFVAGRVLAPIGRITSVARDIEATDLSRRIGLGGPKDELRDLADTFDGMLGRLEDAFEAQRRFIQDASHELRNPLAVMRTNLDVVLADPDATTEDLRRTAVVVERTAERMSKLVDDLLVYARQGLPVRQREEVELAEIVDETVDEFTVPADTRQLLLLRQSAPGVVVSGDRTALKQALANLIGNAVRLAPEDSTISVSSGLSEDGPWAYLSVADEGPGIPEDEQPHVFDRFWRAPDQPNGPDGLRGSGLGLTIVRQTAEQHGGHVSLASTPGAGSTFVLWLPPGDGSQRVHS